MKVSQLILELQKHSPDAEVRGFWDGVSWSIHSVAPEEGSPQIIEIDVSDYSY